MREVFELLTWPVFKRASRLLSNIDSGGPVSARLKLSPDLRAQALASPALVPSLSLLLLSYCEGLLGRLESKRSKFESRDHSLMIAEPSGPDKISLAEKHASDISAWLYRY